MPLVEGQRVLGRFLVEGPLSRGGMGVVFRGHHERHGTLVALKVLPSDAEPSLVERFVREAQFMSQVNHPNLVTILDFGKLPDGGHVIVMELVQGETLGARMSREGPMRLTSALRLFYGILEGLDALHVANIVHRDLKPANVLIAPGPPEVAKIVDLGAARSDVRYNRRLSHVGMVVGTPAYMAPEQIIGTSVDARTDVYAVALMLREVLTGVKPPHRDSLVELLRNASEPIPESVPPPHLPGLPQSIREVLRRSLEFDPAKRPRDAADLASQLREGMRNRLADPTADVAPESRAEVTGWGPRRTLAPPHLSMPTPLPASAPASSQRTPAPASAQRSTAGDDTPTLIVRTDRKSPQQEEPPSSRRDPRMEEDDPVPSVRSFRRR